MKKIICLILAVVTAVSMTSCWPFSPKETEVALESSTLLVHFVDVGQGDCILLESKGEYVLIDAGEAEYASKVKDYIKARAAKSLKYVIATHPHTDHIGGLAEVINSIDTENFITAETDQSTRTWLNVLKAVEKNNVNYIDAVPGKTYRFGEASFTILAPLGDTYDGYNNYSVVTKVTCGAVSFLLTGDAEKQSEYEMVSAGEDLSADVLKCGHHGSSTSSTAKFLKAVRPTCAVISCGENNEYGHPHKETLQKLNLLECQIYRTDQMGTIVARTDGVTITFLTPEGKTLGEYTHTDAPKADITYVGNKNSHVFHLPNCSGARSMSEKNKVEFNTREEAIEQGYKPCTQCNP